MVESTARLSAFGGRARVLKARFDQLGSVLDALADGRPIAGVLFDLGVSSPQLDRPERGFSYRFDGPLDMRMDRFRGATAAELVNSLSVAELTDSSSTTARGVLPVALRRESSRAGRSRRPARLVEVIERYLPGVARKQSGAPCQAGVPGSAHRSQPELEVLAVGLESAIDMLTARGRCVVLSYHSGEDRLVKQCFARAATRRVRLPAGAALRVRSRGDSACPYERGSASRPWRRRLGTLRAASARLRAAERLVQGASR